VCILKLETVSWGRDWFMKLERLLHPRFLGREGLIEGLEGSFMMQNAG